MNRQRLWMWLSLIVLIPLMARAAVSVNVNGTSYTIPQTNEKGWGTNVTTWIQAISANTLQPNGGNFTLTADTNFGANFGLISTYYKSRTSDISTAGALRLANTDTIGWRNAANGGNLLLSVDSSDRLLWNGTIIPQPTSATFQDSGFEIYDNSDNTKKIAFEASGITAGQTRTITVPDASLTMVGAATTQTLTNKTIDGDDNTIQDLTISALKTVLGDANEVLLRDGSGAVTSAAIIDANIDASAAIARSKIASGTASHVLINDGSGNLSSEATLAKSRGGAGADMSSVTFPSTGTIVTRDASETLTNKTLTSPVINTPSTDVVSFDDQSSTPSSPSSGNYKMYFKTDGNLYKLDSNGTEIAVGSGSGAGGINFIDNTDLESATTGFATYADAAATTPVDGTGGSPSLSIARTTTAGEVQRGNASLEITKGAVNEQGEGVSYDFDIDQIDYAASKAIIVTFDYKTTTNYASNDMRVFVYDRDGATLLNVLNSDSGNMRACTTGCKFVGVFYTTSGNNDYRLIFHVATTNATAYDVYIDNIRAGPDQVVPGAIVADLGTETWTDSWANSTTSVRLTRIGDTVFASGISTVTGAGASTFNITIPSTYTLANSTNFQYLGKANLEDTGSSFFDGIIVNSGANTLVVYVNRASSTYADWVDITATVPHTWASGDFIKWQAMWKVSGWQASTSISTTEAILSTVKARYTRITAQSLNSATIMDFSTKDYDTHNAVTTGASWKFTAPKSGYYKVRAGLQWVSRSYTTGNNVGIQLYKNGSFYSQGGGLVSAPTTASYILSNQHSDTVYLRQGDYIDYRATNGAGATNSDMMEITIEEDPDYSIFSVYGNWEIQTTTSSTKTPSATNNYHALTGNSLTLTPGTWRLFGAAAFSNNGSNVDYTQQLVNWFSANGADSSSAPAALSAATGLTVLSSQPAASLYNASTLGSQFAAPTTIVRVTQPVTVYLVTFALMTTASNSRIITYANAERVQ